MKHLILLAAGLLTTVSAPVQTASAQTFPSRPIRIVVPFAAGGPADITSRNIAPRLGELIGQSIVVDNRAGGNGTIGAEAMIRSPADGHTLLMTTASVTSINMVTYAKPPYDTLRDMLPLSPVMTTGSLIVLHPSMPVKDLKEFVTFARARPNQIAFGSAGLGGTLHLGLEMLMAEAKVKITHVAYKGAAPAVTDVTAGQIQGMFVDLPVISPYVKSGRVKAIAVAAQQRSPHFPDIPSAKEQGFENIDMLNYYGLLTQAKVPRDIAQKLHDAIIRTVNTPVVRDRLLAVGADPLTMTIDEFTDYIRKDIEKWRRVVKTANLTFER
ncbi:MAG: tripartite tricarboxylate transporter substrate binding protein [Burkholderiales bacterium]|nr:tripartite tricarboxylate transporter substrate binding protein [Burkholderiales bacterium]